MDPSGHRLAGTGPLPVQIQVICGKIDSGRKTGLAQISAGSSGRSGRGLNGRQKILRTRKKRDWQLPKWPRCQGKAFANGRRASQEKKDRKRKPRLKTERTRKNSHLRNGGRGYKPMRPGNPIKTSLKTNKKEQRTGSRKGLGHDSAR